jgi:DNA-binding CsgD family transcriptional regulator
MWASDLDIPGGVREVAEAARAIPPRLDPPRVVDVLLDAFALRLTHGHAAAAPALARALKLVLALDFGTDETGRWLWLAGGRISQIIALELWDAESWYAMAARQAQFARGAGALVHLQFALNYLARAHLLAGDLATTALMIEEDRLIAEATGNPPVAHNAMMLAAWRGRERETSELIEASMQQATAPGLSRVVSFAAYASAVLNNGLGRHEAAYDAARQAFDRDQLGYGPLVIPELAEAAAKTGDVALVTAALEWLSERTRVTPNDCALGIEARIRALLGEGDAAEGCYQESIERLGRTRIRAELARGHLLYGEWLRRERRRGEAREHLRTAYEMLDAMGIGAFAERARRELQATGETARKRSVETAVALTAQEAQVARLAREGLSNPQIGARLFISTRTVQYHLGKVFAKLGITSRAQLDQALPADPAAAPSR